MFDLEALCCDEEKLRVRTFRSDFPFTRGYNISAMPPEITRSKKKIPIAFPQFFTTHGLLIPRVSQGSQIYLSARIAFSDTFQVHGFTHLHRELYGGAPSTATAQDAVAPQILSVADYTNQESSWV